MKIKAHKEIEVPDGFICNPTRHECSALLDAGYSNKDIRHCANFNEYVQYTTVNRGGFVKCRACIEACQNFLRTGM